MADLLEISRSQNGGKFDLGWLQKKIVDRFTLEYLKLHEDMNLVQTRHTGFLQACVREFNVQMNVTPKTNKFSKKCIF